MYKTVTVFNASVKLFELHEVVFPSCKVLICVFEEAVTAREMC